MHWQANATTSLSVTPLSNVPLNNTSVAFFDFPYDATLDGGSCVGEW